MPNFTQAKRNQIKPMNQDTPKAELLPCPFCGGEAKATMGSDGRAEVSCVLCQVFDIELDTWQTRTPSPAQSNGEQIKKFVSGLAEVGQERQGIGYGSPAPELGELAMDASHAGHKEKWSFFSDNHKLTLLESEIDDIDRLYQPHILKALQTAHSMGKAQAKEVEEVLEQAGMMVRHSILWKVYGKEKCEEVGRRIDALLNQKKEQA